MELILWRHAEAEDGRTRAMSRVPALVCGMRMSASRARAFRFKSLALA